MDATSIMIEMLKQKKYITPLEKDILDTWNELQKYPFDMDSAEHQIISNDINHPKVAAMVTAMPSVIKSALIGLKDFALNVGANVTAALIAAKIQGLF